MSFKGQSTIKDDTQTVNLRRQRDNIIINRKWKAVRFRQIGFSANKNLVFFSPFSSRKMCKKRTWSLLDSPKGKMEGYNLALRTNRAGCYPQMKTNTLFLSGYILDHEIRSIQNNFYWGFRWTAGKFRCTNRYCENNTEECPSSLFQRTVDWNVVWVHNLRNAGHGHQGGCGVSGRGKQVSNTRWYCRNKLEVFLEQ